MLNVNEYLKYCEQKTASENISDILGLQKGQEFKKEMSVFIEEVLK